MTDDDELRKPADWALFRRVLERMRKDAAFYVLALLAAPASTALSIVQPWLLKNAIDAHISVGNMSGLERLALFYLGATIAAFAMESLYTIGISFGTTRTIGRLRRELYAHSLSLSQSFWDRRATGRMLTRATSDIDALGETLTAGAFTIVLDALMVVGVLVTMFVLDARLTLVTLILAPVIAFAVDRIRRILRDLYIEARAGLSALNAFAAERLAGMEVIQLYSDEERTLRRHDDLVRRYRDANVRTNVWDALLFAIIDGLSAVAMALMLWYGSGGLLGGIATPGLLAAFIEYIGRLFRPIQEFSAKIAILQRAGTSLEKIFGLLDHEERITEGDTRLPTFLGTIRVRELHFAYIPGSDVLRGLHFDVNPGEVVALVGRTGSGKTSVARLLTRTYDGYRGSIEVDGVELSRVHPADVRKNLGMVRQDVQLFPATVRFNLCLGRDISDELLWNAVDLVEARQVVDKLGGLDGMIQHHGANMSLGEAQLLSFARVMAHDPPVVLLDEATASIDTVTEVKIRAATRALFARKTVLVIAHRLSTVVDADRIVVIDAGRVVETGTHEELMRLDGAWARLFRQQFAQQEAVVVE